MARITVEDCLEQIDNRFDLVLVAARRARALKLGAAALLSWDDDKSTVLALREIAAGKVGRDILAQPLMLHPKRLVHPNTYQTLPEKCTQLLAGNITQ